VSGAAIKGLSTQSLGTAGLVATVRSPLGAANIATSLLDQAVKEHLDAHNLFAELKDQLSPLQQGDVMRNLDRLMGSSSFAFDPLGDLAKLGKGMIDLGKQSVDWLKKKAGEIKDQLASLPSDAANALADSMRGPSARKLTAGEVQELRKAFGNSIDLSNVRVVNGPGYNPDAKIAFDIGGNPAITEGNTVYIRSDGYSKDFSKTPGGKETLIHEFTHVRQYQQLGFGSFFAKYARDLYNIGDRNKVYDYQSRPNTTFKTETLEGQAQMAGDYAKYLSGGKMNKDFNPADVANRLQGTGIFGL
jgi:hypothetical protein